MCEWFARLAATARARPPTGRVGGRTAAGRRVTGAGDRGG
ncbi:hypothetical protein K701_17970 [Streptomyces fradiae ATCC 10745 = DSM 40063]|uniref:Uncharacterized protein n=1 Tax=Streptomyces fradiae ATCC 10745 = DSM 40063 TaxID=1319510 RepID=A0ABQ6XRW8_STRFR|nr:hypothetical protein K701_17970 [Streptomyces fradiae ATCC 10745 = DSM 40063]